MVVAAFLLDISVFLPYSYVPEVYPYHWKLLGGHLSRPDTCLTGTCPIEKYNLLRLQPSIISLRDSQSGRFSNRLFLLGHIHIIK